MCWWLDIYFGVWGLYMSTLTIPMKHVSRHWLTHLLLITRWSVLILCSRWLLKTLWQWEKLLTMYNFSFCPNVFNLILNPFPHIDAFWRLCSRQLFENIVTKEEIAQNLQFLLLPQCFPLLVISYPFNYRDFLFFNKICSKSSAAELSYEGKGLLPFL